mmetsp:Transcript_69332/g.178683  ORF Transcript_69332/g.178683 Transcript_69332/m.178683 type:complete len:274 (+) Transcript_69332:51-872(+)
MPAAVAWQVAAHLASGANPVTTFPNAHLVAPRVAPAAQAKWAAPQAGSPLLELQQAVKDEDWTRNYEEGLTSIGMRADWSATPERCALLTTVAASAQARRVLEIGSFCSYAALAMAQSLPDDVEVHALEIDPYVVTFSERFRAKSEAGHKITMHIGPASKTLQRMAQEASAGKLEPFDVVIVDADKAGMRGYFELLWRTPGFLSERAVVCVDLTPFKGQPPLRYVKYGFPYPWEAESGQKEIDELRTHVAASPGFISHEVGKLLVVQRVSKAQ